MQEREKTKKESGDFFYKFISVAIPLFLILSIGFFVADRSGVIVRNQTAATVGSVKISVPEYYYYYRTVYNAYYQQFSLYGVDTSKPLSEQMFSETQSWEDYLKSEAVNQAQRSIALSESAKKAGVQLTKQEWDDINDLLKDLELSAKDSSTTIENYIKSMYGRYATRGMVRKLLERDSLASKFYSQEQSRINGAVTDAEIDSAYAADKKAYDLVDYRYFFFSSTPETQKDEEGNDIPVSEVELTAAQTAAKSSADAMLANVTDDASFLTAAADSLPEEERAEFDADAATRAENVRYASLDASLGAWLFDDARKAGDKSVIEASNGYYVALFGGRYREEDSTVTVRHILLSVPAAGDTDEDAEAKNAENDANVKQKVDEIYAQWQKNPTEDNFAALAEDNSADTGSAVEGGLIEKISKDSTVEEFDAWCFDPARKSGDTGIVRTSYGYHIIYFVKTDVAAWKVAVISTISSENVTKYMEDIVEPYPIKENERGIRKAFESYNLMPQQ